MQSSSFNDSAPATTVLNDTHIEAVVSCAESALEVRRRYQFFVWTQGSLQVLLPHQLAICGAYSRARHEVQFEAFNSVPVNAGLLAQFSESGSPAIAMLQNLWLAARCKPVSIAVEQMQGEAFAPLRHDLLAAGFRELLAHGVSRPQRTAEIESFFVLGCQQQPYSARHRLCFELMIPHLHTTWQRVQSVERDMKELPPPGVARPQSSGRITERERQILRWLREGFSNPQIGEALGISALTVKNHVQKILRKLNAANRAQAVAVAISMNLLSSSAHAGETPPARKP
jgi:transcriptional regulator EpsA